MNNIYKILDLFAGVGGFSLGFEQIKNSHGKPIFELHRAVDIDQYACKTLRNRYGNDRVIEGDITKLHIANKIINDCKGEVSIIVGGIPCQSFSLIGPRSGLGKKIEKFKVDKRDTLYEHFKDIVAEIKPKIIIIENVKGILSKKDSNGNLIINKLLSDFEKIGYNFENEKDNSKYMLLNCADYGVPQKRERVILIGLKKAWKNVKVPYIYPSHYNPYSKNFKEQKKKGLIPYVTLQEAIGDLTYVNPRITNTGLTKSMLARIKNKNMNIYTGEDEINMDKKNYKNHLRKISNSGKLFFKYIRPNGYKFINHHVARSQQFSDIKLFNLMKEGETAKDIMQRTPKTAKKLIKYNMNSFLDKYRKQNSNKPCTTVFAHLEKDGNRFIHYGQPRTLTPREVARVQSFPDDFLFSGPFSKKYKQIGNAIPPLLSKAIAETITKVL